MTKTFENTVAVGGVKENTDYAYECETVISYSKAEPIVQVSSTLGPDITKLLKNPGFTVISDTPASNGNPRVLIGTLPAGAITFRASGKRKRTSDPNKPKRVINAAKCGHEKDDGTVCRLIAKKDTGKCRWHSPKVPA